MYLRYAVAALLLLCPAAWAQRKTIYVITDAEGVAGICRQEQTDPDDQELRDLLTGEVNAAVEGFLAGGADEVLINDGHGGSKTLSALTIHPKAKLLRGPAAQSALFGRRFSAVAFIGQHAMANTQRGIMGHSFDSLGIQNMLLNGKPVGEIGVHTAIAGYFGTPVIMLSGDQAAADELRAIVPEAEVAVVKEGLGRYTCISLSAAAARDAIREAARRSMAKIGVIKPYTIPGPLTLQIEYTTRNSLPMSAGMAPNTEVLDDRTIRYHCKDILDAWVRYVGYR